MPAKPSKTQRWIDLLAALLVRHFPVTLEELIRDVPAYQAPASSNPATFRRMFERDKDELRRFGVPIETTVIQTNDGPCDAYRLSRRDFYLPYLYVATADRRPAAPRRRADQFGYQALTTLMFEPDELEIVAEAAARVRSLGEPLLQEDADSAVRKLSLDLPIDTGSGEIAVLRSGAPHDAAVFQALSDALVRRKVVRFQYHTMSTDQTAQRTVEPYGLFFFSAHWYLAARDRDRHELRTFRLSRIASPEVNPRRSRTPDYDVPATFHLRDYARARHPWELGDGDVLEAVVDFTRATGVAAAAAQLGEPVSDAPPHDGTRRSFHVRRVDAFARWLLSFGGDAVPAEPPVLVEAYDDLVRRTLAAYAPPEAAVQSAAPAEAVTP